MRRPTCSIISSASTIPREGTPDVVELAELAECDIVIEALPAVAFAAAVAPALERGRIVIVASGGALLDRPHLIETARHHGGRLVVPSGALAGLDAVRAAVQAASTRL